MAIEHKGNQAHLTLSDRIYIEQGLERQMNFKEIAIFLQKDPTTISKEIRRHRVIRERDTRTALCTLRGSCTRTKMCPNKYCGRLCGQCTLRHCHSSCPDYLAPVCRRLERAPYVCNGCGTHSCRQSTKYTYRAQIADQRYREALSSSRSGINRTPLELDEMDRIVSPLLRQGQSLSHIYATHDKELNCSRRTMYHYIDQGAFHAANIDLPRKVRYKPRKKKTVISQTVPSYREDRTYKDFERFIQEHPNASIVEMDTVEGIKCDSTTLLTMLFRCCNFMFIFLLKSNTQQEVCRVFNEIETALGTEGMLSLFAVILTDNGSEFKAPLLLERNLQGNRRTNLFYCNPMASWQKGKLEKNHEFIRCILPKGRSFEGLKRKDIVCVMNHINSVARASLNNRTPFELASLLFPDELLRFADAQRIAHDEVLLKPWLIKGRPAKEGPR